MLDISVVYAIQDILVVGNHVQVKSVHFLIVHNLSNVRGNVKQNPVVFCSIDQQKTM